MFAEENVMELRSTGQFSGYLIPMRKLHNWGNSGASRVFLAACLYSSEKLNPRKDHFKIDFFILLMILYLSTVSYFQSLNCLLMNNDIFSKNIYYLY